MKPELQSLTVKNFRTHTEKSVEFSSTTTLITGLNGSGKTSLIEAVYIALQGSSFKGSDGEILKYTAPWYRIDLRLNNEMRTVKFDPAQPSGKKKFIIDEKIHYRLPHTKRYPVVLFEPEDLRLIHGSPARRRLFLDRFIKQIDPHYDQAVKHYERALKQRNSLLKKMTTKPDDLFIWDVSLSKHGSVIVATREKWISELNKNITLAYKKIANTDDSITIRHNTKLSNEQSLLNAIHKNHERDIHFGFTSVGPHRDDIIFLFNNSPADAVASRGETRSIILALKLIEVNILTSQLGQEPLILLDDVFSELDEQRQQHLSNLDLHQIIITSTSAPPLLKKNTARIKL